MTLKILAEMKHIKANLFLIIALGFFWMLFLPFLGSIPYLDGGIDFVKASDFYFGGFPGLFSNWHSIHPPFKELLTFLTFKFFGLSSLSYGILGPTLGSLGLIVFYCLTQKIFGESSANVAVLLFATNPLFISVGFFALTDFLLTVLMIISLYYYSKKKFFVYSIFSSLSFLAKETGLILSASVLLVELIQFIKNNKKGWQNLRKFFFLILPFVTAGLWFYFLKINSKPLWSDWNFSQTTDKGTVYTIINNLITFEFLNKYAYQNWLQLFILNFNWVYWLFILVAFLISSRKIKSKEIIVILTFSAFYLITVLSFQTYTIPRYALPLYPFILMGVGHSLTILQKRFKFLNDILSIFLLFIVAVSLFYSLDPISKKLWGKTEILGQEVYALNNHLAGNDGMTYNMQYAFIVKERTKQILSKNEDKSVVSSNCYWLFPDPNNDFRVTRLLNLEINTQKPCVSKFD